MQKSSGKVFAIKTINNNNNNNTLKSCMYSGSAVYRTTVQSEPIKNIQL